MYAIFRTKLAFSERKVAVVVIRCKTITDDGADDRKPPEMTKEIFLTPDSS